MSIENEVLKTVAKTQCFMGGNNPMCINVKNIASLIGESDYKTRKAVKSLREKGLIELVCRSINTDEELFPPYWGYKPTKKGSLHPICQEVEDNYISSLESMCSGVKEVVEKF